MASQRHLLRTLVIQTVFAWEFRGGDPEALFSYNLVNGGGMDDSSFALQLLQKIVKNHKKIQKTIQKYAPEWPMDKIAPIDRAVLELSIAEMLYDDSIPALVAINEGIELAKEYGNESSSKFVNGVLSSLYDDLKQKKSH